MFGLLFDSEEVLVVVLVNGFSFDLVFLDGFFGHVGLWPCDPGWRVPRITELWWNDQHSQAWFEVDISSIFVLISNLFIKRQSVSDWRQEKGISVTSQQKENMDNIKGQRGAEASLCHSSHFCQQGLTLPQQPFLPTGRRAVSSYSCDLLLESSGHSAAGCWVIELWMCMNMKWYKSSRRHLWSEWDIMTSHDPLIT